MQMVDSYWEWHALWLWLCPWFWREAKLTTQDKRVWKEERNFIHQSYLFLLLHFLPSLERSAQMSASHLSHVTHFVLSNQLFGIIIACTIITRPPLYEVNTHKMGSICIGIWYVSDIYYHLHILYFYLNSSFDERVVYLLF